MDKKLLEILVCPVSKGPLQYDPEHKELLCFTSHLAYPVKDGVPIMLESEARSIKSDSQGDQNTAQSSQA